MTHRGARERANSERDDLDCDVSLAENLDNMLQLFMHALRRTNNAP
jgi:hypothetical protein